MLLLATGYDDLVHPQLIVVIHGGRTLRHSERIDFDASRWGSSLKIQERLDNTFKSVYRAASGEPNKKFNIRI